MTKLVSRCRGDDEKKARVASNRGPFFVNFARETMDMVEVKADVLEESFDILEAEEDGVAALKGELETLKAKIAAGVIAPQRPALDGVKSAAANMFTEQYLRRGIDSGLEVKAIGSSTDAIGGYAVPREIDAGIDSTLNAISPIRAIECREGGKRRLSQAGHQQRHTVGLGRL